MIGFNSDPTEVIAYRIEGNIYKDGNYLANYLSSLMD